MVQNFAIDFILIYLVTRNERLCAWLSFRERYFQKVISLEAVGPKGRWLKSRNSTIVHRLISGNSEAVRSLI